MGRRVLPPPPRGENSPAGDVDMDTAGMERALGGLPCGQPLPTAPRGRHKLSILDRAPHLRITHSFGNNFLTKPQVGPLGERLSRFWALAQPHPSQCCSCVAPAVPAGSDSASGEQESWTPRDNVEGELSGQTTQEPDQCLKPAR